MLPKLNVYLARFLVTAPMTPKPESINQAAAGNGTADGAGGVACWRAIKNTRNT